MGIGVVWNQGIWQLARLSCTARVCVCSSSSSSSHTVLGGEACDLKSLLTWGGGGGQQTAKGL